MSKKSNEPGWVKILQVVIPIVAIVGVVFLLLSSYGLFHNYISVAAKYSPWYMKLIGTVIFVLAVVYSLGIITERVQSFRWAGAVLIALIGLGISFNVNFQYDGHDERLYRSLFNDNGTVKMENFEWWLNKNKELYESNGISLVDTSFTNYVLQYQELPGRNKYNSLIRLGKIPKSKAPRANEDFPLPEELLNK